MYIHTHSHYLFAVCTFILMHILEIFVYIARIGKNSIAHFYIWANFGICTPIHGSLLEAVQMHPL